MSALQAAMYYVLDKLKNKTLYFERKEYEQNHKGTRAAFTPPDCPSTHKMLRTLGRKSERREDLKEAGF